MIEKTICNLSFDEIKELANIVSDKNLGKIAIKSDTCELVIEAKKEKIMQASSTVNTSSGLSTQSSTASAVVEDNSVSTASTEATAKTISGKTIKAPLIGTFYSAPAPDKPPFVQVGQKVKKGDVLFIIESMKLMNEIQSEFDGTVAEILVEDGASVEYDQPILVIN